jgi:hypothetical protein
MFVSASRARSGGRDEAPAMNAGLSFRVSDMCTILYYMTRQSGQAEAVRRVLQVVGGWSPQGVIALSHLRRGRCGGRDPSRRFYSSPRVYTHHRWTLLMKPSRCRVRHSRPATSGDIPTSPGTAELHAGHETRPGAPDGSSQHECHPPTPATPGGLHGARTSHRVHDELKCPLFR